QGRRAAGRPPFKYPFASPSSALIAVELPRPSPVAAPSISTSGGVVLLARSNTVVAAATRFNLEPPNVRNAPPAPALVPLGPAKPGAPARMSLAAMSTTDAPSGPPTFPTATELPNWAPAAIPKIT